MRRLVLGFVLAIGMLLSAVTSASAHTYCSVDPTVGVGTPVKSTTNINVLGSNVYLKTTSSSTTFDVSLGLP
ncbi:MAG: hypothetical protein E6I69_02675 [Chloroflexi bacterium]|nr:MAG: hypothetical protein E6J12_10775 [Chloroflexota bacterium]TME10302.1 MAG: hypothetical protein E6I69_02675 [Chloroflexota bacterium]TME95771.1 MAG: hypothetical protein E6I34_00955 [Chloroflexota bacterium]